MLFQFLISYLVTVALSDDQIHKRMSPDEVQEIFQTSHESVPDYAVVQFSVSRLVKRGSRSARLVRALHSVPFGGDLRLRIQPAEGHLAGRNTPVYIASRNERMTYTDYAPGLRNVGQLMEDPPLQASMMLRKDAQGRWHINGVVRNKRLVIRSLPDAMADRLLQNYSSRNRRSAYHVVFRQERSDKRKPTGDGRPGSSKHPKNSNTPGSSRPPNNGNAPGSSRQPNNGNAPGSSRQPNNGNAPGSSRPPNNGNAPGSSRQPNNGNAPGTSRQPNNGNAPGSSRQPNNGNAPGPTKKPNNGNAPGPTKKPNNGNAPRPTKRPNNSNAPGSSKKPNNGNAPGSSSQPDNGYAPIPDNQTVVYPEIMLVLDSTYYSINNNNVDRILAYAVTFWNGVDLMYRSLEEPKFRFNLKSIIIAETPNAVPYIFHNIAPNTGHYDAQKATVDAGEYYYLSRKFPRLSYDAVITMSRTTMSGDDVGIAMTGGACRIDEAKRMVTSVAIVQDNGSYEGVHTAAHEFAHLVGARHDDDKNKAGCRPEDGYIMTAEEVLTEHSHDFSICSIKDIRRFLNRANSHCVFNEPVTVAPLKRTLPGQMRDRNDHCVKEGYGNDCFDENNPNHSPCLRMYCLSLKKSNTCRERQLLPPDGAFCGRGKKCFHGYCVSGFPV